MRGITSAELRIGAFAANRIEFISAPAELLETGFPNLRKPDIPYITL